MSGQVPAQDAWKTPEIRQAEAALEGAVAKSRELLKSLEKLRLKPLPKTDTPERVEAVKRAASKPDASAELRLVKKKVDAGKLTWEDVASGRAFADPDVRALASGKLGEAKDMYEELQEGLSPEEVLEAREGARSDVADTGRPTYPAAEEEPKGFSNEDPLASSAQPAHEVPEQGRHGTPPQDEPRSRHSAPSDDDFADPLADRGPATADNPGTPPPPPAPPAPDHGRHAAPRYDEPAADDEFTDPLADRDSAPNRQDPPPRRRPADPSPGDDDYFGGSPLG
ncbi:hypothetical protein [Amycolatopsis sp. FDAARGOS 1241]|uniref:hypothetical protein n=1 Tax=Amycolatopsis sp. FDAARGOS 1241 TaxID=2778070 RepID=UPI001951F946|nr:hypothetical protein [Amycolatopsis sp. FDAARGOS 1241]QRP44148.1 hypothetical protein I6J71_33335 [Amycolatopsis sp. FDAARGOS 1241]